MELDSLSRYRLCQSIFSRECPYSAVNLAIETYFLACGADKYGLIMWM